MNNFKGKSILYICCAIIFSVTSCINAEVNYYKISIHCRKTNVKLKLISKDTSLVYKGEFYTKTDLFFKWEYEYGFESAIFEFDSLIVYKIENEQIIDSLLFGKSNLSRRNLLLPQNYKNAYRVRLTIATVQDITILIIITLSPKIILPPTIM